jgi:hypothetical protein
MHTAYYAFLKQAKLWELHYAMEQPDPEAERAGETQATPILAFESAKADAAKSEKTKQRRAA